MWKSPSPQLGSYKKDFFLDKRISYVHYTFSAQRGVAPAAKTRLKVNQAAAGENLDGRGRDMQLPGSASAKRALARKDRSPRRRATHVRPTAHSAIFLAAVCP